MMISLKELMLLERILLELDAKHKFELDFGDAYKLHEYLTMVGKITSYAFLIQDEFHNTYNDVDKLKEYHNKVMDSTICFNHNDEILSFVSRLNEKINDNEINNLILKKQENYE